MPVEDANPGSLTLYYRSVPRRDTTTQLSDAALRAEVATQAVQADVDGLSDEWGDDPEGYRKVHIAAGMLSIRLGVNVVEAIAQLRAQAFGSGQGLASTAQAVLDGQLP